MTPFAVPSSCYLALATWHLPIGTWTVPFAHGYVLQNPEWLLAILAIGLVFLLRQRRRVPVLLVASPTLSAGLNLPWVSHVVLFHRMRDREAAAQLVARGQRLGREANLQVVELLYEGELEN